MKTSKNYKRLCLVLGLSTIVGTGALTAATGTKNLKATYRNIGVTYNGVAQSLSNEPFTVDGVTYLPLREISTILGASVDWNGSTNTVAITGSSSNTTALEQQLSTANYNLTVAQRELAQVKAELETYKSGSSTGSGTTTGTTITAAQLKETENYLIDNFSDYFSNITFDFDLTQSGSRLEVVMSYENRSENTAFNKLTEGKIETFMKKIGDNIAATHKDIEIQGKIQYTKDDEEKASFTRTKAGKYSYAHAFDISDLQEAVTDELGSAITLGSDIGSVSISSVDADIRESRSTINVKIYLSLSTEKLTKWTELTSSAKKNIISNILLDAQEAVLDRTAYNYDVNVTIYGGTSNTSSAIAEVDADEDISVY